MSRYCEVNTEFKNGTALIQALMETGNWTISQIEINDIPKNLLGYRGDRRQQKAHIIIRRQHVGSSSNDIGFIREDDGSYVAIISEFDASRFNESWISKLKGNYAFHALRIEQETRGRRVSRTRCERTGRQRITIIGYR